MDEINWFIDYYSDIFSLDFEYLFSSVYLENVEAYENDTAPEVENATNRAERKGGRASELSSQKQGWKQKKLTKILIMKFSHFAIDTIDW